MRQVMKNPETRSGETAETQLSRSESVLLLGALLALATSLASFTTL